MPSHENSGASSIRFDSSDIRMLDHAAVVFARGGFDAARTRELANEEFSEAKYFKRFGTKKGILRGICDFMWGELHGRAKALEMTLNDPVARVRAYLELYVDFFSKHEHICRVVSTNTYPRDEAAQEQINYHACFQTVVLRSIIEAQRKGKLCDPGIPIAFVYHALRGAVSILLNQCYLEKHIDKRESPSFTVDDVSKHVGDILRGFLKVPGSTITEQIEKELSQYRATIQSAKEHLDALGHLEEKMAQTIGGAQYADEAGVGRGSRHVKGDKAAPR